MTSGGHYWRPVQTWSLEDPSPPDTDICNTINGGSCDASQQINWQYFSLWVLTSSPGLPFGGGGCLTGMLEEVVVMWYSWCNMVAEYGLSMWWHTTLSLNGGELYLAPSVVYSGPDVCVWWESGPHTISQSLGLPECNKCIVVSVSSRCVV